MKIAILSWTFYPALGGTQVFLYRFIEELVRKGHEVDIYLPSYCYKESKKFENKSYFKPSILLRKFDEAAKRTDIKMKSIHDYEKLLSSKLI